jgi:hypothetical protein
MKVINVAGFDVKFDKNGKTYFIPNDSLLHSIPDECFFQDNFQGLLRVIVPPVSVKQVVNRMNNFNKFVDIDNPSIKEIVIDEIEKKKNKPLAGKKLKNSIRQKLRKTSIKKPKKEEEINV